MKEGFVPENRLLFALAVLFIPIFDTLRVLVIRLINRDNPFEADRNHMHHVLLDNGLSHKKASLVLGGVNLSVIILYILLSRDLKSIEMSIAMLFVFIVVAVFFETLRKKAIRRAWISEISKSLEGERTSKDIMMDKEKWDGKFQH